MKRENGSRRKKKKTKKENKGEIFEERRERRERERGEGDFMSYSSAWLRVLKLEKFLWGSGRVVFTFQ